MKTTLRPENKQPNSFQICWLILQVYRGSFTARSHMVSITSIHYPIAEPLTSGSSSVLPSLTCDWAPNMQSFTSSWGPRNLLSYYRASFKHFPPSRHILLPAPSRNPSRPAPTRLSPSALHLTLFKA